MSENENNYASSSLSISTNDVSMQYPFLAASFLCLPLLLVPIVICFIKSNSSSSSSSLSQSSSFSSSSFSYLKSKAVSCPFAHSNTDCFCTASSNGSSFNVSDKHLFHAFIINSGSEPRVDHD